MFLSASTQMKKHRLIHTGEKPYPCWQCGQYFRRKETRDTHLRYHTGERPYSCSICTKKYISASHLRVSKMIINYHCLLLFKNMYISNTDNQLVTS